MRLFGKKRRGSRATGPGLALLSNPAGYLFAAAATILLIVGLAMLWSAYRERKAWLDTDARVMRAEIVVFERGGAKAYRLETEFGYLVQGQPFLVPHSHPLWSTRREDLASELRQFAPGSLHEIHFNPRDPYEMRLDMGENSPFTAPLILLSAGVTLSAVFAGLYLRQGKYACASCGANVGRFHRFCHQCGAKMPRRKGSLKPW